MSAMIFQGRTQNYREKLDDCGSEALFQSDR